MKNILKILAIVILAILLIFLSYRFVFSQRINKSKFESENMEFAHNLNSTPFSVSKIIMYSSGYGENKNTTFGQSSWILDILQYTDIAIYIDNGEDKLTYANSIKDLYIDNINITAPKLGTPELYFLDSLNFGTANIDEEYRIDDSLQYTVLNDSNEENNIQSNTPVFFSDCSNPLTLKYVNNKIKENYSITTNEPIFFDGRLLKTAEIPLTSLKATVSFKINIEANSDDKYYYTISLPIELDNNSDSIFNGNILIEKSYSDQKFIKINN